MFIASLEPEREKYVMRVMTRLIKMMKNEPVTN